MPRFKKKEADPHTCISLFQVNTANDAMSSLKSIAAQAVESAGIPQPAQSGAVTSQSTTLSQPDSRGKYNH